MTTRHAKPKVTHKAKPRRDPHPAPPLPPQPPEPPAPPPVDVAGCFVHLLAALDGLARSAGSPPDVMHELDALRAVLGKEP